MLLAGEQRILRAFPPVLPMDVFGIALIAGTVYAAAKYLPDFSLDERVAGLAVIVIYLLSL